MFEDTDRSESHFLDEQLFREGGIYEDNVGECFDLLRHYLSKQIWFTNKHKEIDIGSCFKYIPKPFNIFIDESMKCHICRYIIPKHSSQRTEISVTSENKSDIVEVHMFSQKPGYAIYLSACNYPLALMSGSNHCVKHVRNSKVAYYIPAYSTKVAADTYKYLNQCVQNCRKYMEQQQRSKGYEYLGGRLEGTEQSKGFKALAKTIFSSLNPIHITSPFAGLCLINKTRFHFSTDFRSVSLNLYVQLILNHDVVSINVRKKGHLSEPGTEYPTRPRLLNCVAIYEWWKYFEVNL